MDATSGYKKMIKNLFQLLEPNGNGKVHKDTLKKNMEKMLIGNVMGEKEIEEMLKNMSPDKDGMISIQSCMNLFSMPGFSAEEAAATRMVLKKNPQLLDALMDGKGLAAKVGYDRPQEVEQIVGHLKECYLENLDRRLKKEPPKSKKVVLEKQAQLMRAFGEEAEVGVTSQEKKGS